MNILIGTNFCSILKIRGWIDMMQGCRKAYHSLNNLLRGGYQPDLNFSHFYFYTLDPLKIYIKRGGGQPVIYEQLHIWNNNDHDYINYHTINLFLFDFTKLRNWFYSNEYVTLISWIVVTVSNISSHMVDSDFLFL